MNVSGWDWWIVAGGLLQVGGAIALVIDLTVSARRIEREKERRSGTWMAREEEMTSARSKSLARVVFGETARDRRRRYGAVGAILLGVVLSTVGSIAP